MATKYYYSPNASRRIAGADGTLFNFEVIDQFVGKWRGVLAEDDAKRQESLAPLVEKKLISEITEGEYQEYLKKKTNPLYSTGNSNRREVSALSRTSQAPGVRLVQNPEDRGTPSTPETEEKQPEAAVESEEDILSVEAVAPPKEDKPAKRSRKKKSEAE